MILNLNIGVLGHVDSGKTTLAKVLSDVASTAAFDKHPQSKERGITLDLGFSALFVNTPDHLKAELEEEKIQLTLVDCPGHASLIRTIIGGAQIVDIILLVVDALKGIQTQTAECLIVGELTCKRLIVVINKIDLIPQDDTKTLDKLRKRLRKVLEGTAYNAESVLMPAVSALTGAGIQEFIEVLRTNLFLPTRNGDQHPFLFAVDHCFAIKGQGTVCTGTVIQGQIKVGDSVEIAQLKEIKKVKTLQVFRKPVQSAKQGDRVGLCITQFDPSLIERGLLAKPGLLTYVGATIFRLNRIKYYKYQIKSKMKLHFTIGHTTVMGHITLFQPKTDDYTKVDRFDASDEFEYIDELQDTHRNVFVLVEFETAVLTIPSSLIIGSKLDVDVNSSTCRLAFWGKLDWCTESKHSLDYLPNLKIYKYKEKHGTVQRLVNDHEIIVQNLFKKTSSNRDVFIGMNVSLSTGEEGRIESTFGQTSKLKIRFENALNAKTLELLNGRTNDVKVYLKFKKYIFNKTAALKQ